MVSDLLGAEVLRAGCTEDQFAEAVSRIGESPDGAPALAVLLLEQHPVYESRPPLAVARMRGWIIRALSRFELPDAALAFVLEELESSLDPYLITVAAVCLRSWPHADPSFAPALEAALTKARAHDAPISLETYGGADADGEFTSPVRELLLTIAWMGPHAGSLAASLGQLREAGSISREAEPALESAVAATGSGERACCAPLPESVFGRIRWARAGRSATKAVDDSVLEDQSGKLRTYAERFRGHCTVIAFFYSRCDNPMKCSLTVWKLGRVQKMIEARGLGSRIHTAAISYDSAFDTPARMFTYGLNRGFRMDASNTLLRTTGDPAPIRRYFDLGVSFYESLVSRHRVEVFLLDEQGRAAASFTRRAWSEEEVVNEAVALMKRPGGRSSWPSLITSAAVAAIPKCPACWASYLGALGLSGVMALDSMRWLAAAALAVNVLVLGWNARWTGPRAPHLLSLLGSAIVMSQLWVSLPYATAVGLSLVVLGAVSATISRG